MKGRNSWAEKPLANLIAGRAAYFNPHGKSMEPRIHDGQAVTVVPFAEGEHPKVGMVVLCRVNGTVYLHEVKAIETQMYLIGNMRGRVNGWTGREYIYGRFLEW